jgi:stringent starvation protein B
VPISHVIAIYARENGQGMAFPLEITPAETGDSPASQLAVPAQDALQTGPSSAETPESKIMQLVENVQDTQAGGKGKQKKTDAPEPPKPPTRPRPSLKRVK